MSDDLEKTAILRRKHPVTGETFESTVYIEVGGRCIGRVRWNDGWNASLWDPETQDFDPMEGVWRRRDTAVDAVVAESDNGSTQGGADG